MKIRQPPFGIDAPVKALFLDFDGVVMDSMEIKLDSYCHAFDGFDFNRELLRKAQIASAGLARQQVIPFMYVSLTDRAITKEEYGRVLARFADHDAASRGKMKLFPGVDLFLKTMHKRIPMAIVTGTPQEVIDETLRMFDLGKYFHFVKGAPGTKVEHLGTLMEIMGVFPRECFYVGDAVLDQEAARFAGIPFIGIDNGDHPFKEDFLLVEIKSLGELGPLLTPSYPKLSG